MLILPYFSSPKTLSFKSPDSKKEATFTFPNPISTADAANILDSFKIDRSALPTRSLLYTPHEERPPAPKRGKNGAFSLKRARKKVRSTTMGRLVQTFSSRDANLLISYITASPGEVSLSLKGDSHHYNLEVSSKSRTGYHPLARKEIDLIFYFARQALSEIPEANIGFLTTLAETIDNLSEEPLQQDPNEVTLTKAEEIAVLLSTYFKGNN